MDAAMSHEGSVASQLGLGRAVGSTKRDEKTPPPGPDRLSAIQAELDELKKQLHNNHSGADLADLGERLNAACEEISDLRKSLGSNKTQTSLNSKLRKRVSETEEQVDELRGTIGFARAMADAARAEAKEARAKANQPRWRFGHAAAAGGGAATAGVGLGVARAANVKIGWVAAVSTVLGSAAFATLAYDIATDIRKRFS